MESGAGGARHAPFGSAELRRPAAAAENPVAGALGAASGPESPAGVDLRAGETLETRLQERAHRRDAVGGDRPHPAPGRRPGGGAVGVVTCRIPVVVRL